MKVLFLPINIASMPAITAQALNKLDGVEAKCLTLSGHKYQEQNSHTIILNRDYTGIKFIDKVLRLFWRTFLFKREVKKWIRWADVIHYTWSAAFKDSGDVAYAHQLNKVIFIEWVGSDIRDPEYLKTINPFYKEVFDKGYEYAFMESKEQSERNQNLFAKYKAIPLDGPEMSLFIDRILFTDVKMLYQRIDISSYTPQFPDPLKKIPLIIHSPSAIIAKGTNIILPVIEELRKNFEFEFKMVHGVSRAEALKMISEADIFIDQLIGGSYGMAAIEGMCFGKPVMCYIMPEVFDAGLPEHCPIVNTNPDTLKENLTQLLREGQLRHETGVKSRTFAEEFHDADKIASTLKKIYQEELNKRKS